MRTLMFSILALGAMTSVALAEQLRLTDDQMDKITGGRNNNPGHGVFSAVSGPGQGPSGHPDNGLNTAWFSVPIDPWVDVGQGRGTIGEDNNPPPNTSN